jgi:Uma2 family endonuclease
MFQRIEDFLAHGTKQVWVVTPSPRQIWVYLPDGTAKRYEMGDTISYRDLLPGIELDVKAIFED